MFISASSSLVVGGGRSGDQHAMGDELVLGLGPAAHTLVTAQRHTEVALDVSREQCRHQAAQHRHQQLGLRVIGRSGQPGDTQRLEQRARDLHQLIEERHRRLRRLEQRPTEVSTHVRTLLEQHLEALLTDRHQVVGGIDVQVDQRRRSTPTRARSDRPLPAGSPSFRSGAPPARRSPPHVRRSPEPWCLHSRVRRTRPAPHRVAARHR